MRARLPALALVLLAACAGPRPAQAPLPSDPLLPPGPFPVGFASAWTFDEGRTYRTAFDDGRTYGAAKAPRPVLVLLWYPAEPAAARTPTMAHERYFAIESADPRLAAFAPALAAYARGVFVEEVLDAGEAELDEALRAELAAALGAPTACHPDARPAAGRFPLVVYHGGAGSSFEDNAALCEHLASHGYVVLGSAFPRADGSSLGIDGGRGSAEDVQCLVRWAGALPFADPRRVGLVGHSAGAQALLRYAAQPGGLGDALVLLDTTQDYYALGMPLHEALVEEVRAGAAALTLPMLVTAGPEAIFALCDTLVNSERTYLTVPELGHDEFIAQGHQRLARLVRRQQAQPGGGGADEAAEAARAPAVRANYRALCACVRSFLDATLRGERADFTARLAAAQPWSAAAPSLTSVPRGASGPAPYDAARGVPPTPREFRRLFEERGVDEACAVLQRFRGAEPRGPLYTSTMLAGSLLYGLMEGGRRDEAARYYAALKELGLPALSLFSFLADVSCMQAKPQQALHFLRIAHELDAGDAEIAAKLAELEAATPP